MSFLITNIRIYEPGSPINLNKVEWQKLYTYIFLIANKKILPEKIYRKRDHKIPSLIYGNININILLVIYLNVYLLFLYLIFNSKSNIDNKPFNS